MKGLKSLLSAIVLAVEFRSESLSGARLSITSVILMNDAFSMNEQSLAPQPLPQFSAELETAVESAFRITEAVVERAKQIVHDPFTAPGSAESIRAAQQEVADAVSNYWQTLADIVLSTSPPEAVDKSLMAALMVIVDSVHQLWALL